MYSLIKNIKNIKKLIVINVLNCAFHKFQELLGNAKLVSSSCSASVINTMLHHIALLKSSLFFFNQTWINENPILDST